MAPLRWHPRTREELTEAAAWYEARRDGLGDAFVDAVQDVARAIAVTPCALHCCVRHLRTSSLGVRWWAASLASLSTRYGRTMSSWLPSRMKNDALDAGQPTDRRRRRQTEPDCRRLLLGGNRGDNIRHVLVTRVANAKVESLNNRIRLISGHR